MKVSSLLLLGCIACGCTGVAHAGQVEVDFVGGEVPTGPGSTVTIPANLPVLLGGNGDIGISNFVGDTLFLKFKIPDVAYIEAVNSFVVNVTVFDNGDGGGESGDIDFALPGTNIVLASPAFTTLNRYTLSSPLTLSYTLTADEIAEILPTISDGNFRLRIVRDTGDFEVAGGSASIDAILSPEPSSALLMTGALCGLALLFRRGTPACRSGIDRRL